MSEVPAMLRTKIWLGLANEDDAWHRMQTEGELAVYAETVSTSCLFSSTKLSTISMFRAWECVFKKIVNDICLICIGTSL